ncbi:hypothetical protein GGR53DRAFT_480876 [Hypoxylon sp. FL1150]|nr:hypothetical protein GGR53DRAFT_480876 [Hypoxylon sp. FL1150]
MADLPFPHASALLPPGFTLARCTPADDAAITSVYMRAFPAGSDFTYWWPRNVDNMRTWQASRIRGWLANPRMRQFKVVEEATGKMVAFTTWDLPMSRSLNGLDGGLGKQAPEEEGEQREGETEAETKKDARAPEDCNMEVYEELFAAMNGMREKWRVDDKLPTYVLLLFHTLRSNLQDFVLFACLVRSE